MKKRDTILQLQKRIKKSKIKTNNKIKKPKVSELEEFINNARKIKPNGSVLLFPSVLSSIYKSARLRWHINSYNSVFDANRLLEYNGIRKLESEKTYKEDYQTKHKVVFQPVPVSDLASNQTVNKLIEKNKVAVANDTTMQQIIQKEISCGHGTVREESALDIYFRETDKEVFFNNVLLFQHFETLGATIGGRIDGITGDKTVVEAKNRIKGLFDTIPVYEKLQIYCYLKILGLSNADLIQKYNDQFRIHRFEYSETFWNNRLLPFISDCVAFVKKVQENEKEYFALDLDEKKEYILSHFQGARNKKESSRDLVF